MKDSTDKNSAAAGEDCRMAGDEGSVIILKNVMETAVTPPPAGFASRLAYWESVTGLRAGECAHEVCHRPATEGAVAMRAFSADKTHYVFPACETCARRTEMLYVNGPFAVLD